MAMTKIVTITKAEVHSLVKQIKQKAGELAEAIRKLRDSNGWRVLGYSSWAACCEAEFGYSKRHANRLIQSQEVIEQVGHQCPTSPPPTHAAILAKLPEDQRSDCWQDVLDECEQSGEKPTAAAVREKVNVWAGDNEPINADNSKQEQEQLIANSHPCPPANLPEPDTFWQDMEDILRERLDTDGVAVVAARLENLAEKFRQA